MAFDFEKLMDDPSFQMGLAVLGGSAPNRSGLLNAYQVIQNRKKMELEKQQQAQQMELERARSDLYRQQIEATKAGLEQKQKEMQQRQENLRNLPRLLQQLQGGGLSMGGQGSVTGSPMANTQTPQAQPGLALPPMSPTFSLADSFVSKIEGGYVPNDAGAGPTNFGINQRANPDINVKALTPEAAAQIRKQRYWDAIGADKLEPDSAMVAYDAAINQGQGYAKELLGKTGGDPALMLYQRRQDYRSLAKSNPIYKAQLGGWESRLDQLQAQLGKAPRAAAPAQPSPTTGPTYDTGVNVDLDTGDIKLDIKPSYRRAEMEATERRHQEDLQQRREVEKRQREEAQIKRDAEARQAAEAKQKLDAKTADATAAYRMGTDAVASLDAAIDDLQKDPGLARITGLGSWTNRLAIPGQPAHQALSKLEGIQAKLIHDVLQATRRASENGASGYGQFTEKELEVVKKYIENLDPGRKDFKQALTNVRARLATIQQHATEQYNKKIGSGNDTPVSLDDYLKSKGVR